jgi:deoxyribodipyrimidine photo-lyase
MLPKFETEYRHILQKIEGIDPIKYAKTRNFLSGDVTYLSPYISRGVISTKEVLASVLAKGYKLYEIDSFAKELAWRDYFQRVGQHKDLNQAIKQEHHPVKHHKIPDAITLAQTDILGIDEAIKQLYATGYMHNHCRMYTAMVCCNIGQAHWLQPAKWLYYHLLDADWASNSCSWQWVAGANSSKKYYANQENINKYTYTKQTQTFLDISYEALAEMDVPKVLEKTSAFNLKTALPLPTPIEIDNQLPTYIYNFYNLDPTWKKQEKANRILLLEPNHFEAYPISTNSLNFMLGLGKNIPNLQIFVGEFNALKLQVEPSTIHYKEHPFNQHYTGERHDRNWMAAELDGYFPSFFSYWKQLEKYLKKA